MINIDGQLTIKLMKLILIFDNLVISHFQRRPAAENLDFS
jgi:hypothetical protein